MMDILMSETCWAHKKWNKIASDIKLVFHSSTIQIIFIFQCHLSRNKTKLNNAKGIYLPNDGQYSSYNYHCADENKSTCSSRAVGEGIICAQLWATSRKYTRSAPPSCLQSCIRYFEWMNEWSRWTPLNLTVRVCNGDQSEVGMM